LGSHGGHIRKFSFSVQFSLASNQRFYFFPTIRNTEIIIPFEAMTTKEKTNQKN
jgi:hypothetical protein